MTDLSGKRAVLCLLSQLASLNVDTLIQVTTSADTTAMARIVMRGTIHSRRTLLCTRSLRLDMRSLAEADRLWVELELWR